MKTIVLALAAALACGSARAADWPQWRGPTRDGKVVAGEKPWPRKLTADHLVSTWRVDLGQSYCGPIVAGDRVFTAESAGGKELVIALDRASGKELWRVNWEGQMTVPFFAWRNGSWVRATPAFDGKSLYVAGMRDVLVSLDAQTGKENWRVDFVQRYKTELPGFGFVSSPLIDGDSLYVQAGAAVVKLKKATGESVWRSLEDGGGMWGSAFSSPILASIRGQKQLVVQARTDLAGIDPETGKVLWKQPVPAFRGMNIINPVVAGDFVFTSSYGGGTFLFSPEPKDGQWTVGQPWTSKIEGYMNTPAVVDGHAYLHGRDQTLRCINLTTGQAKWRSEERFGQYMSMVQGGDHILALDQRGELILIRATPEKLDIIDRRQVSEQETWAHLAVIGGEIYIRELKAMARWDWK